MIQLEAAGASDVGRVRRNNQDAFLMGESVFAVADGMGGHLAGEVASATALEPIQALDGRIFPDASHAVDAVVQAVVEANTRVSDKASSDTNYQGMGTTLTAAVFEGRRLHIAHVGDSRAYLLRDGTFSQITTDHTLVQHLIDEGQITSEEASTHPQRSIITRAIGVANEVEVDSLSLELEPGDVVLLCSDGLSGFVPDAEICKVLLSNRPLDDQVEQLLRRANDAGGADNITAVLLRYGGPPQDAVAATPDTSADGPLPGEDAGHRGAGATGPVVVRTNTDADQTDWAQRLGRFGSLGTGRDGEDETDDRSGIRFIPVALGLVLLLVLLALGGRWLLSRSYYVGIDRDTVAIYQGIPVEIGPIELSWVVERTSLRVDALPDYYVASLEDGIAAIDRRDARLIVENAPRRDAAPPSDGPTGEPTSEPTMEPSPEAP